MNRIILAFLLTCLVSSIYMNAEAQSQQYIQEEFRRINKFYDSSTFLAFNTTYTYDTDTVLSRSKHTSMSGKYQMYEHKCFYTIGSIDYLRSDSFSIAAYNDDKFLIVSPIRTKAGSSNILPSRAITDSLISNLYSHYSVSNNTIRLADSSWAKHIRFERIGGDTTSGYDYVDIVYDSRSYALKSFGYGFRQNLLNEEMLESPESNQVPTGSTTGLQWKVRFKMSFDDYSLTEAVSKKFSESTMINEEYPGKWVGVGKYVGYNLYLVNQNTKQ